MLCVCSRDGQEMAQFCLEETSCCSSQALPSSVLNLWLSSCHLLCLHLPVPCPVCAAVPTSPSQWDQPPTLYLHLQALCGGSGMSQSPAKRLTHSGTGQGMRRYWWPEDRRTWDALQLGLAPICGQSGSSPGHQGAARTLKHGFPSHWLLHSIQPPPVLEGAGHCSYQSQGLTPTSLLRSPQSSGAGAERSNRPSSAAGLTPGGEQEIVPGRCSARG